MCVAICPGGADGASGGGDEGGGDGDGGGGGGGEGGMEEPGGRGGYFLCDTCKKADVSAPSR